VAEPGWTRRRGSFLATVLAGVTLILALVLALVSSLASGPPNRDASAYRDQYALPTTCTQFARMIGKCTGPTTTTTTTTTTPPSAVPSDPAGKTNSSSGGSTPAGTPSSGPAVASPPPPNSSGALTSGDPAGPCAGTTPPVAAPTGSWACTFDDEFNGTSLDTTKWSPMLTYGSDYMTGTPGSAVCYVDNPDTISESGGTLNLSVDQTTQPFTCQGTVTSDETQYEGGMVISYQKFSQEYGYFEVRAAMPPTSVPGLQETLWLYPEQERLYGPGDDSGEIDYGEFYSLYPYLDIPVVHYPGSHSDPNATSDCSIGGDNTAGQFNTYALLWTPTTLTTYYNGIPCMTDVYAPYVTSPDDAPEPFNQPFFLAFTAAFGSSNGDQFSPGETPLPATTQIDWVRVWQYSS
jgi:beta-glucanase (GH16 family)